MDKKKRKKEDLENNIDDVKKSKKNVKEKIRDPKIKELLKLHENDELFNEFLKVVTPNLPVLSESQVVEKTHNIEKLDEIEKSEIIESSEKNEVAEDIEEEEKNVVNVLANQDISDSEYIKLKTGQDIKLQTDSVSENESKKKKKQLDIELYTVKIKGLPSRVKKSQIREFLKPLKPFTIRRALKTQGIAYCGFKTEKEMKQALLKNRAFLSKFLVMSLQFIDNFVNNYKHNVFK